MRFPSPYRRRVTSEGVEPRAKSQLWRALILGEQFVLSRKLVHFEFVPRPPGAVDSRAQAAVRIGAAARSPFDSPGFHFEWSASGVGAWSWDRNLLNQLGVPEDGWVVPETVLTRNVEPGYTLAQRLEGWESLVRDPNATVLASRFWSSRPSPEQEDLFQRASRSERRNVDQAERGETTPLEALRLKASGRFTPTKAAPLALLLLGSPLAYLAGQWLFYSASEGRLERSVAALQTESQGQYAALQRYRSEMARLETLRSALEFPDPMRATVELGEGVAEIGGRVERFRVDPGRLSAQISANADPAEIASTLEFKPSLQSVELERDASGRGWSVEARVVPPETAEANDDAG